MVKRVAEHILVNYCLEHPGFRSKLEQIYNHEGAKRAKAYVLKVAHLHVRAAEIRSVLKIRNDDGAIGARDIHAVAWSAAGWKARPWWASGGSSGKTGRNGGRQNPETAVGWTATNRG